MAFLDILPDPDTEITDAGTDHSSGAKGPGFASISVTSNDKVMMNRTNTGRVITRKIATQQWKLKISYNPLTRDEFEPVYNFLLYYGKLRPFFVRLPQHEAARNSGIDTSILTDGAVAAGAQSFVVDGFGTLTTNNRPRPGDMFTITDTSDTLHTKAYRVVRVEDYNNYEGSSRPNTDERRLWIHPALTRATPTDKVLNFASPQIRVIMSGDVIEYNLKTDNLYTFGLNLEEANA